MDSFSFKYKCICVNEGVWGIASRIGDGNATIFEDKSEKMPGLKSLQQNDMMFYFSQKGFQSIQFEKYEDPGLNDSFNTDNDDDYIKPPSIAIYYYHPDHLGTNTIVTNMNGNIYQYFLNLPFGETMAEQTSSGYFQSPWKFNGKELDAETGLYYYGARYYYPRLSNWLSVDPLATETPALSPYIYCNNSPSVMIDPDGRYTKLGAWIRNIWWGGNGISKSGKEWGVQLGGIDLNGDCEIVLQTKGSKHWFRDDYIAAWKTNNNLARTLDQAGIEYSYTNDVNEARLNQLNLATFLLIPTPLLKTATSLVGSGGKAAKGVTQPEYTFTKTAGKHLTEVIKGGDNAGQLARPYMKSPLTIKEIMSTGKGIPDATYKGGMNWRVPGTFRGSQGIWELGINPETNVIYHFNFTH